MTWTDDIGDLLDTGYLGQAVTVARLTVSYGDSGDPTKTWTQASSGNADIQPSSGSFQTVVGGVAKISTHMIFATTALDVQQGDRVRPSGWASGDDEYEVDFVSSYPNHKEIQSTLVVGHA